MGVYGIEGPEAMVSGVIFSRSIDFGIVRFQDYEFWNK